MSKANETQFILKLFEIVQNKENDDIVCWSQCGNELVIMDTEKFTEQILRTYFKHNSLTSFIR